MGDAAYRKNAMRAFDDEIMNELPGIDKTPGSVSLKGTVWKNLTG